MPSQNRNIQLDYDLETSKTNIFRHPVSLVIVVSYSCENSIYLVQHHISLN